MLMQLRRTAGPGNPKATTLIPHLFTETGLMPNWGPYCAPGAGAGAGIGKPTPDSIAHLARALARGLAQELGPVRLARAPQAQEQVRWVKEVGVKAEAKDAAKVGDSMAVVIALPEAAVRPLHK